MRTVDILDNWVEPREIKERGDSLDPTFSLWLSYIRKEISPDVMTVLFRLMFPVFLEIKGCVLLPLGVNVNLKTLSESIERLNWSPSAFESSYNATKIYDIFSAVEVKYEESFEQAAELLKNSWEISLQSLYPDKKFKVVISNSEFDYGPTLTFYSVAE